MISSFSSAAASIHAHTSQHLYANFFPQHCALPAHTLPMVSSPASRVSLATISHFMVRLSAFPASKTQTVNSVQKKGLRHLPQVIIRRDEMLSVVTPFDSCACSPSSFPLSVVVSPSVSPIATTTVRNHILHVTISRLLTHSL